MTKCDKIVSTVSVAPLLISASSLYFQFFWKPHSLVASVSKIDDSGFEVVLLNKGAAEEVVFSIEVVLCGTTGTNCGLVWCSSSPAVVAPSSAEVVKIACPQLSKENMAEESLVDEKNQEVSVGLEYTFLSPFGEKEEKSFDLIVRDFKESGRGALRRTGGARPADGAANGFHVLL